MLPIPFPLANSAIFPSPEAADEELADLLLDVLPPYGRTIGNLSAREALARAAERPICEDEYEAVKETALALGMIRKDRGRGGAIGLAEGIPRRATGCNGVAPEPSFQIGQKLSLSQLGIVSLEERRHLAGQHGCLRIQGLHLWIKPTSLDKDYIFWILFLKRLSDTCPEPATNKKAPHEGRR
jgi:hypothetical protein